MTMTNHDNSHERMFTSNADRGDPDLPWLDLSGARVPTSNELADRTHLPKQAVRFSTFALRLTRMVLAGHH